LYREHLEKALFLFPAGYGSSLYSHQQPAPLTSITLYRTIPPAARCSATDAKLSQ